MATCTGYAGPTPELLLARSVGLRRDLRRTLVGHMGCYAAFNALKVAADAGGLSSERTRVLRTVAVAY